MKDIYIRLEESFKSTNLIKQRDDLYFVSMPKDRVIPALKHLRDNEGFTHLVMLTAVDYIEDGEFELNYLLHNHQLKITLGVKTRIDRENAEMQTFHELWGQCETYERELHEMFGIYFPGSPRLDENFLLEGWDQIPPMRRDFDTLQYSKENYYFNKKRKSNDPRTYMQQKGDKRGK
ncbi:MAG: hypothetical protein B6226_05980 [Candidatus Cloacimonetes bacterium 4572_65]|nr:MAG: hypothetical protein B6226_05980 [Candidatus Cloacimonetes bacterium 4572_65]